MAEMARQTRRSFCELADRSPRLGWIEERRPLPPQWDPNQPKVSTYLSSECKKWLTILDLSCYSKCYVYLSVEIRISPKKRSVPIVSPTLSASIFNLYFPPKIHVITLVFQFNLLCLLTRGVVAQTPRGKRWKNNGNIYSVDKQIDVPGELMRIQHSNTLDCN